MQINTYYFDAQLDSAVTTLTSGGWVVTWISDWQDGNSFGVYSQIFAANGVKIGDETQVSTATIGQQVAPAVAALSDGGWVVTWASSNDYPGSSRDIFTQACNANGTRKGVETLVNTTTANNEDLPAIATLKNGGWVVTWVSTLLEEPGTRVFAQIFNADGSKSGGELAVSPIFSSGANLMSVAALSDGGWVASWSSP